MFPDLKPMSRREMLMKCKCAECRITKTKFVKGTAGKGLILGKNSPFNKITILGAIL